MRPIEQVSADLFEKLRNVFPTVSLGDENAESTIHPEKAMFFNFDYAVDKVNLGNITVSLMDDKLQLFYSKNITENLTASNKMNWYGFLKDMRKFAMRNMLEFDTRDITKSHMSLNDVRTLASSYNDNYTGAEVTEGVNESSMTPGDRVVVTKDYSGWGTGPFRHDATFKKGDELVIRKTLRNVASVSLPSGEKVGTTIPISHLQKKVTEGKHAGMYGTTKSSYQQIGSSKLIVRHDHSIDENKLGARGRNIRALYIENKDGERFKLEHNNLLSGRILARHLANGGQLNDDFTGHVNGMINELKDLRYFVMSNRNRTYEDSTTEQMVEAATEYYGALKDTLRGLRSQRGYSSYVENWKPDSTTYGTDVELKERFTVSSFNDKISAALPHVAKAYQLRVQEQKQIEEGITSFVEGKRAFELNEDERDLFKAFTFESPEALAINTLQTISRKLRESDSTLAEFAFRASENWSNLNPIQKNLAINLTKSFVRELKEGNVLKSIKRATKGWGGEQDKPKDLVKRNRDYDDKTVLSLRKGISDTPKSSPAHLQKRVLDREIKKRWFGDEPKEGIKSKKKVTEFSKLPPDSAAPWFCNKCHQKSLKVDHKHSCVKCCNPKCGDSFPIDHIMMADIHEAKERHSEYLSTKATFSKIKLLT